MGKYDAVRDRSGWGVPGPGDINRDASQVNELVGLTHNLAPNGRQRKLDPWPAVGHANSSDAAMPGRRHRGTSSSVRRAGM